MLISYTCLGSVFSQNLDKDLNSANQVFIKNNNFSVDFKFRYFKHLPKEKPVFTVLNKAYRYQNRFYLWTEEREFIYKNNLSLVVDYKNGLIALQEANNPINEILSSTKLSNAIKSYKYDFKIENNSKVYTINYPLNNKEQIKKLQIQLRKSDNMFQKMIVYYNSEIGTYKNNNESATAYSVMEIAYENFKLNTSDAVSLTDFDKYISINGDKAVLKTAFNKYTLSDLRIKKTKKK